MGTVADTSKLPHARLRHEYRPLDTDVGKRETYIPGDLVEEAFASVFEDFLRRALSAMSTVERASPTASLCIRLHSDRSDGPMLVTLEDITFLADGAPDKMRASVTANTWDHQLVNLVHLNTVIETVDSHVRRDWWDGYSEVMLSVTERSYHNVE